MPVETKIKLFFVWFENRFQISAVRPAKMKSSCLDDRAPGDLYFDIKENKLYVANRQGAWVAAGRGGVKCVISDAL